MKEYTLAPLYAQAQRKAIAFHKMCHETEGPTHALPELHSKKVCRAGYHYY